MRIGHWPALGALVVFAATAAAQAPSAQMPPPGPSPGPAPMAGPTPTPTPPSPGEESAGQNVKESEQYEKLLCSNPGFRKTRMEKECGPITDPQLKEQCLASFNCAERPKVHPRRTPASER
ncbi:MAG TPA: hypothetical protein VFA12_14770 [Stellaceae bacterium]|nr:hypothetical protein [Stellaceae bacterium]